MGLLTVVVRTLTPLFPPGAEGVPFVPAGQVSAAPHAAEGMPLAESVGLSPPFRVVSDYAGDCRVDVCSPVGGRIFRFTR